MVEVQTSKKLGALERLVIRADEPVSVEMALKTTSDGSSLLVTTLLNGDADVVGSFEYPVQPEASPFTSEPSDEQVRAILERDIKEHAETWKALA